MAESSTDDAASPVDDGESVGFDDPEDERELPQKATANCPSWLPGAASSFTIAFNYGSASMASLFMGSNSDEPTGDFPDYPEPGWAHAVTHSAVFVGSIVGMLVMGQLGDQIGIRKALVVTNSLVMFSALASALLTWGPPDLFYALLTMWRFLLGVGVGGNYPLSAAKASAIGTVQEAVQRAGHAFFWQGPGAIAPYILGWLLLRMRPDDTITSIQFRLTLGAGAVPAAVIVYFMAKDPEAVKRQSSARSTSRRRNYGRTLLGTAGTWLFYDIAYYGTIIFAPVIMSDVFPQGASLSEITVRASILPLWGILGILVGISLLQHVGPKILNAGGLIISSVLYIGLAIVKRFAPGYTNTLSACLCAIFFFLTGGPGIATYVLPVMAFPQSIRATYHGRSGSAGKVGAMVGTFIFPLVRSQTGLHGVFIMQAIACTISAIFSIVLIKPFAEDAELVGAHSPEQNSKLSGVDC
jgi:PHS family inorganic phosphate transporter-like MFS transporter